MKWLREPFVQFLLVGAILALAWSALSGRLADEDANRIEMDAQEIELLAANWERQWQRPPTEEELRGLVDSRVREEILYRTAQSMGLDRNDVVVRRRMVQKMELLSQDLATITDPPETEVRTYFAENRDTYLVPPQISFRHVYFNLDQRGYEQAEADARALLAELRTTEPDEVELATLGDRFMLASAYRMRTPEEIAREFGSRFAEAIVGLERGWHGPIGSGYGTHLVGVTERVEARPPEFEEVRERVTADYSRVRRERANELLVETLSAEYEISIDSAAIHNRSLEALREAAE
ncbi:MAG: peptidylprolyl isomerase [marine benthic group bacterium]|nr:peptidylprolyl isomerase [Gemmatimonadota bacterium]